MKIAWWSAGATSAVAIKIALEQYTDIKIYYIDIASAHEDNVRFMRECEKWYGQKILSVQNDKGYKDQFDVIEDTRFINGPFGARCSLELKKLVREKLQKENKWDNQIFGYEFTRKEINRAIRFKEQYPDAKPLFPLIEKHLTKPNCHQILKQVGIKLPKMYELGFENNNCIGCVKGGKGYWNLVRKTFPHKFNKMAKLEREIGHSCLKNSDGTPIFLDELNKNAGISNPIIPECGLFCQVEFTDLMDSKVEKILNGEISL